MRGSLLPGLAGILLALAACETPPPTAYFRSAGETTGTPLGNNTTGELCTMVTRGGGGADIFCGAWKQPSARVRPGGPANAGNLNALATASPWRVELESRFACGEPRPDTAGTLILQCNRRAGGWAQVALVTVAGGNAWLADGTPAAYPVIQRAIAQLSGTGTAAAATPVSADMASYLAARAFSAGDIAQYEGLMAAGLKANLAGRPEQAEEAYRAALGLQEKAQGRDSPAAAAAMMSVALQVSVQGRFDDAQGFFTRAERLLKAPGAAQVDRNGLARLTLYLGLHALNQGDTKTALKRFAEAETAYRVQVPDAREKPVATSRVASLGGGLAIGDALASSQPYATLAEKEALLGILEARRDRAVAFRLAGDAAGASEAGRAAETFAQANGLTAPIYAARLQRTLGINAAADNQLPNAIASLGESVRAFRIAQPRTRPIAETDLARADLLNREGQGAEALAACRAAAALLQDTKDGVDFERMQPCLGVYAAQAAKAGPGAQKLLAEMFASSQLTRGTITDQEIRRTAVRLAAGGSDPKVSEAIRKQQDADRALSDLLRERDAIGPTPADAAAATQAAKLDKDIATARTTLEDADGIVQAAAPNYQQLIQQPVKPEDVFAALRPSEAFVAITLARTEGWTFVLRGGQISVARVEGGAARMADLVKRVRASIVPGDDNRVPTYDVTAALDLYTSALGGVAGALEGAKLLTVAPTGPLLSIPFEVLLTGPANANNLTDAPFLVRKFVISHVPAAANFVKLRQTAASTAAHDWFGFGDFRPITQAQALKTYQGDRCRQSALELAGLPGLPGTQAELGLAARIFGAAANEKVTGAGFTVPAVKKLRLADYKIVHFATHALLPAEIACQDEPAIVTSTPDNAPDAKAALLTSGDISGLKLNADAVILSACNSGGPGGTTAGESLAGLARAFFYAGARSLMVTHWTVEDEFATYLVALSLNNLKEHPGDGLAAGLQKAQLTFLSRTDIDAPLKHPYYWAPFALVGEGGARTLAADAANLPSSPRVTAGL